METPLHGSRTYIQNIGVGSFGSVAKYQLSDGRYVAIKRTRPREPEGIDRTVVKEIHFLQYMNGCTNILQLINAEFKMKEGFTRAKLILTYHAGNLSQFIRVVPQLERIQLLPIIMKQLFNGLYQLYHRGVIHQDIKPDNILVDYEYDMTLVKEPTCYIADFGISSQLGCSSDDYFRDNKAYTPLYRPPEVWSYGKHNMTGDIWALGMTLLEYVTGEYVIDPMTNSPLKYIFSLLVDPIEYNKDNIMLVNKHELHGYIDVVKILIDKTSPVQHRILDDLNFTSILTGMLSVSPSDRYTIEELYTGDICISTVKIPNRGQPYDMNFLMSNYYLLIDWIMEVSNSLKLKTRTLVGAIDILDRCLANFLIEVSKLQLLAATCIFIVSKIEEIFPPEILDLVHSSDNTFSPNEIKEMEITVFKSMNYILYSCEIDDYVNVLSKSGESGENVYELLRSFYESLGNRGLYAGELSYPEITRYYIEMTDGQ